MGDRYRQYKSYDVDAYEVEQEYNDRFKEFPKAPRKKHKTEDYKGKFNEANHVTDNAASYETIPGAEGLRYTFLVAHCSRFCLEEVVLILGLQRRPPMTLNHHRRLAPYAENMVDVTCRHIDTRSEYDHDYIGH